MKKRMVTLLALLVAVAIAMPAFAGVDFKYGGQFRTRWVSNDHFDGTDLQDDNRNYFDQRLRLYFFFVASENLRLVTRFEVGDITWGDDRTVPVTLTNSQQGERASLNARFGSGGRVGADSVNVETKNVYVEFGIPTVPVKAKVGIQGINLLDSWIVDDDFSAAVLEGKFTPVNVQIGYIAAQNSSITDNEEDINSWFGTVDYKYGPWAGALLFYAQHSQETLVSTDPVLAPAGILGPGGTLPTLTTPSAQPIPTVAGVDGNTLFDLGLNVTYKMDWLKAYVSFVKNLGGVDFNDGTPSTDYTGWMIDGGVNVFCGPYTFNLGGFYTSGQDFSDPNETDITSFTYPLNTTKYFSEIVGGGILDRDTPIAHTDNNGQADYQWNGYGNPWNLWTVTAGAAWQALEKTKLSASYWYFGTAEDVQGVNGAENSIGHEFDVYLTQGIVDGLTLDIVGAYLITGDAYTAALEQEDAYEVGARLQWSF